MSIRFGTWNIGTLTSKSLEVVDAMVWGRINIICLQKSKWVGEKARELDTTAFKLRYIGKVGSKVYLKEKFWEDLQGLVQDVQQEEKILIVGDVNGHISSETRQFASAHGGFGFGELMRRGNFSMTYNFKIVNTCFKKRDENLITYKSGTSRSQIDFFLLRSSNKEFSRIAR
ncbi:hypothetical protein L6164_008785 [Bauhinia variegata]|uniref:Uncharacterized protein n=1 Tax=Bauhinia variegata TaxID=167791 RepID=A0ACB9PHQ1_BAUVA|nr:hypothetical protein L6164_008785 [Bauhinia variegata]